MRRRTKQTSAKRRIFLFLGLLLVFAGLVVAARFYRTKPLIEPESPEMAAKRMSPDNAYYALLEVAKDLPAPPKNLRGEIGPSVIASQMAVRRPDDDPEMIDYFETTRPAAEAIVQILDQKAYYCAPLEFLERNRQVLDSFQQLARILCAHALYAAKKGNPEQASKFALSCLRLGDSVAKDGPFDNVNSGCEIVDQAAACAMCLPWADYSQECLRSFSSALDVLRPAGIDLSRSVDWEFRLVEAGGIYAFSEEDGNSGLMASMREAALRRFLRKHEAALRKAAQLSYPELPAWSGRQRRTRHIEHRVLPTRLMRAVESSVVNVTRARTSVEGLRAVLALALYKMMRGTYPELLEALTPEFLDSVPVDAYMAAPLRYSAANGTYRMYSVGLLGKDDAGDPRQDVLFPPPTAAVFQASLKSPDE
ncbi:MAG TPA: hypothetical protein PLM14_09395 [Candidatus Hydrogenedentes bacterium]|nr:hypothetical protein [Candidatus Hydrogenedentota bacterium]